ncbi:MAG: ThiF family adenylyltransferase [Halococcoides sp.]
MNGFDADQLDRYARQIVLEAVGPDGQARLADARVLIVGAGGLGSPLIAYLAAAGVGELVIVDDDRVERSNLQRQIVHGDGDRGRPKVASAAAFVEDLNPEVSVETHETTFDLDLAREIVPTVDVAVDATDDFGAAFVCNDAAMLAGVPAVFGSVLRFEGQVTVVDGQPCYRCLFGRAPPPGEVPDCASAGVLGAVPGTIGTMQATAALHALIDTAALDGRHVIYDATTLTTETVDIAPNPECPICGPEAPIDLAAIEYDDRYGIASVER